MEANKRHKRTPSVGAKPGYSLPYLKKKRFLPKIHGKFQVGKVRPEKKNIDVDLQATIGTIPSLATATPIVLNTYTAGTGPNNALGRRAVNMSLLVRMAVTATISSNAASAVQATTCRVLALYDRQPAGAIANVATILGSTTYGACSVINLANSDRFSVLFDEKFVLGGMQTIGAPTTATSEITRPYFVDRYIKCKLPSEAGTSFSGAIGGITEGAILLLCWSDIAAASSPPTIVSGVSRIRFVDN